MVSRLTDTEAHRKKHIGRCYLCDGYLKRDDNYKITSSRLQVYHLWNSMAHTLCLVKQEILGVPTTHEEAKAMWDRMFPNRTADQWHKLFNPDGSPR